MSTKADASKNKNKYTSNRLSHIITSLPYAFLSLFCKRDKNLIVFCVINDDEKRQALINEYGPHFIDTRTKEGKRLAIKAATWVVSWLDLPIGGLFLNFRRFVLHLGHGTPLKELVLPKKTESLLSAFITN